MTDTAGSINSKGLDTTGFDEDLVGEHFNKVGTHVMCIVDLQVVDRHGPSVKGKRKVTYVIDTIEPALDETVADHLRGLLRALYRNRAVADGQLALDESLEPSVKDHLAEGAKHRPHPFIPVDAASEVPICDVCGAIEDVVIHGDQSTLPDPFALPSDDE